MVSAQVLNPNDPEPATLQTTNAKVQQPHKKDTTNHLILGYPPPKLTWKLLEALIQRIVVLLGAPLHFHVDFEECMWVAVKMMVPFLGPQYHPAPNVQGTPKGTIICRPLKFAGSSNSFQDRSAVYRYIEYMHICICNINMCIYICMYIFTYNYTCTFSCCFALLASGLLF